MASELCDRLDRVLAPERCRPFKPAFRGAGAAMFAVLNAMWLELCDKAWLTDEQE